MVVPDAVCASAVSRHPFPTQSPPNERWSNSPLGKCKTKLRLRQLLVATRPASSGAGRGRSRWLLPAASPPAFWESDLAHTLARSAPADPLHGNKTGVSAHTPGLLVAVVLWGGGAGSDGLETREMPIHTDGRVNDGTPCTVHCHAALAGMEPHQPAANTGELQESACDPTLQKRTSGDRPQADTSVHDPRTRPDVTPRAQ